MNEIRELCTCEDGRAVVLQGNVAFAIGCVRSGIHAADGYPGTPSTEVIDKGLSKVQDLIEVGWSVNEAVAMSVGLGHSIAGNDVVVTMKIPGLFQAGDIFTSTAFYSGQRGALIHYVASDFTPSSTQHLIDPRPFFKSCFVPVLEPRSHQEMMEFGEIAANIARRYECPIVVHASGVLCHSEGLVRLNRKKSRSPLDFPDDVDRYLTLPPIARKNYDAVMDKRMPALTEMVESSPLNIWEKGAGKSGVITYGVNELYVREVKELQQADFDILSLAFSNPLPLEKIREFCSAISGDIYVFEDGYRYLQDELERMGIQAIGKSAYSKITEWNPQSIAKVMGFSTSAPPVALPPVPRAPSICAGCPYRSFAEVLKRMKKKKHIAAVFGDIGCNTLLYFLGALDTCTAMGASDGTRQGVVLARPELATKCISVLGDSTECHSGMDATRNAIFRQVPGVKVILDNEWTGMTGGQPAPTSPVNLAGKENKYNLVKALEAHGDMVLVVNSYERAEIESVLKEALDAAKRGEFVVLVVQGTCLQKVEREKKVSRLKIDPEKCKKCSACLICPGIEGGKGKIPNFTHLCTGCGGENPACLQACRFGAIKIDDRAQAVIKTRTAPPEIEVIKLGPDLPEKIIVGIRGVGGQGNLFFGKVLARLALLAGYREKNILKGETHGMAQLGGPVISTFSCGRVYSPILRHGTADALIVMEESEVLRPGFLEMAKREGHILIANTRIISAQMKAKDYPAREAIEQVLKNYHVIEVNTLSMAQELGDVSGKSANIVMLGCLSELKPFSVFPEQLWLQAIKEVSPTPALWASNYCAFEVGRKFMERES